MPQVISQADLQDLNRNSTFQIFDQKKASKIQESGELLPSEFAERMIHIDGKPFSDGGGFESRPYLKPIYNGGFPRLILKSGRQVEKSSTLGNRLITLSLTNPFFRSMYVTPIEKQVSRFSMERLERTLATSPALKPFHDEMPVNNVTFKEFPNHSTITLGSVYHTADGMRGVASDNLNIDELQDIISDHIPVLEETLSHSKYQYFWGAGTPKSIENPIEIYWDRYSTQHEWTVPCERHTPIHWNLLGIKNVGLNGLCCDKCGEIIHAPLGKWQMLGSPDAPFRGYHISQLMVPWIKWSAILDRLKRYPTNRFYNEVLGLSFDSGLRPISREDLIRGCQDTLELSEESLLAAVREYRFPLFMGIDWGTGMESYTVVTILGYHPKFPNKLALLYAKRFIGEEAEPAKQLDIIKRMISHLNIEKIGCDWGFGHFQNDVLMREFGRERVISYMYSHAQQKKVNWDPGLRRYIVNRTAIMSDVFNTIKRQGFVFPNKNRFLDEFGSDFLNIFSEFSERSRQIIYNHPIGRPDDTFHSFTFGLLASMLSVPRPDILDPQAMRDWG